jgi:hypothetical protein
VTGNSKCSCRGYIATFAAAAAPAAAAAHLRVGDGLATFIVLDDLRLLVNELQVMQTHTAEKAYRLRW